MGIEAPRPNAALQENRCGVVSVFDSPAQSSWPRDMCVRLIDPGKGKARRSERRPDVNQLPRNPKQRGPKNEADANDKCFVREAEIRVRQPIGCIEQGYA